MLLPLWPFSTSDRARPFVGVAVDDELVETIFVCPAARIWALDVLFCKFGKNFPPMGELSLLGADGC